MIEEVFLRVTLILFFVAYIINIHTCFKTMKELEDFKIEMRLMMHSISRCCTREEAIEAWNRRANE